MDWIRTPAAVVLACLTATLSVPASAQSEPVVDKRQKVDVRAMVPGPQASDVVAESPPASGLTRDQRKEATLQARQDGTLRPTGEGADLRDAKPAPVATAGSASAPPPSPPVEVAEAVARAPELVAATSPPAKKTKSKKARPAASSAPA